MSNNLFPCDISLLSFANLPYLRWLDTLSQKRKFQVWGRNLRRVGIRGAHWCV